MIGFLPWCRLELRNPLHGIIGSSDVITRSMASSMNSGAESVAENVEMIESMKASATLMLSIVTDILDLQKFESGSWILERIPYDMHSLFHTISSSFRGLAKSKEVGWNVFIDYDSVPRFCVGDPFRIRQCVVNLVSK
jgi:signal transduction histidine kinase